MTTKTKGRDRLRGGAAQKTSDNHNCTGQGPLQGWFNLAKSNRINRQQKRCRERARK